MASPRRPQVPRVPALSRTGRSAETGSAPSNSAPPKTPSASGFRADIEGLRGVAVLAVLLYHGGVPSFTGGYIGVDIFFVISGFLITGLLLREMEETGTVSLPRFFASRAKRLLPSLAVVLSAVAVLSWVVLSPVRRSIVSGDILAAGVYGINWRQAWRAVDYFGAGLEASPVQHFWSLSVEEQFYLVWPALLLAVTWRLRRGGRSLRPALLTAVSAVAVLSLGYSVYLTAAEAGAAYFSTFTRGWELALGSILALALARADRISRPLAATLSAGGMGAIAWACLRFTEDTLFPGAAALVPVLGAGAIIAAGSAHDTVWPQRVLALRPVRHVGRISYVWYLWHWPLLVLAQAHWGDLSTGQSMLVVAASYVPTLATHRLVEEPFRRARVFVRAPRRALRLGFACTGTVMALGLVLQLTIPAIPTAPKELVAGSKALDRGGDPPEKVSAVRPAPRKAKSDRGQMYADDCLVTPKGTTSPPCVYGDESASTTVVLFGDSHAMQWFPALVRVARERDWRLVGLAKAGCPPAQVDSYTKVFKRAYSECASWRERALQRIEEESPDMVVTSSLTTYTVLRDGNRLSRGASDAALTAGYAETMRRLQKAGARVTVMAETPRAGDRVPHCVSRHPRNLDECAEPRREAFDYARLNTRAAHRVDGVTLIDAASRLCPEGACPPVVGKALVYRNGGHLTATYVRTLHQWLARRLPPLE